MSIKVFLNCDDEIRAKLQIATNLVSKHVFFRFLVNWLVRVIRKRFPGFSKEDVYLAIVYATLSRMSDLERTFLLGYRTKESDSLIQPYLNRMKAKGLDYFPEEDWLR